MKIYTKYGDTGFTRLYGGERVSKTHARVEAYGTMDELCSSLGYLVSLMADYPELSEVRKECQTIQQQLFDCGSDLATPHQKRPYKQTLADVTWLEERIDAYKTIPPQLEHFLIPGGHLVASSCHVARTLCRRLERRMVAVMEEGEDVHPIGLQYVNRLSDYFFVLARLTNHLLGEADTVYHRSPKIFRKSKDTRKD